MHGSNGSNIHKIVLNHTSIIVQAFTTGAYEKEAERIRKTVEIDCAHNKYSSMEQFISFIQSLVKKKSKTNKAIESMRISSELHEEIGRGFCHNCAIYVAANIMKILNKNSFTFNLSVNPIRNFQSCDPEEVDIIGNYFSNSLQYLDIAYFIFNQSNVWIRLINTFHSLLKILSRKCEMELLRRKHIKYQDMQRASIYAPHFTLLLQLIRNIKLFHQKPWTGYGAGCNYFKFCTDHEFIKTIGS